MCITLWERTGWPDKTGGSVGAVWRKLDRICVGGQTGDCVMVGGNESHWSHWNLYTSSSGSLPETMDNRSTCISGLLEAIMNRVARTSIPLKLYLVHLLLSKILSKWLHFLPASRGCQTQCFKWASFCFLLFDRGPSFSTPCHWTLFKD